MIRQVKIIALLTATLCVCPTVRADMMPLLPVADGYLTSLDAGSASAGGLRESSGAGRTADAGALPGETQSEAEQAGIMDPVPSPTEDRDGVNLWFCAVSGLGLCRSSPFARRVCIGRIMDPCLDDGPSQIGHSTAVSPNGLGATLTLCFIQSICAAEDYLPRYYQGDTAPSVRESQFTPITRIPRGPPVLS